MVTATVLSENRSHVYNPHNDRRVKRDKETGQFMDQMAKPDKPFKSVRNGPPRVVLRAVRRGRYSVSKPLFGANFRVRLFSVTVRTTLSGAPAGTEASISNVTRTDDPTKPARCVMTSSAMRPASRPTRVGSRSTVP